QSLDMESRQSGGTRVMTVRFGNVLGSRGSVVPLFQQQIAKGGPITITDEAATRYFMTIREASQLVVQASVMEKIGVEPGSIVVLDMGEPVRIVDLARNLIRLSGLEPDRDISLEFVGLRPGERLTEDLFDTDEEAVPTAHRDLMIARPNISDRSLIIRYIDSLGRAALDRDEAEIRRLVARYLIHPSRGENRKTHDREAGEPGG
ncbi:UDP-N-acetylglucosamine 4,6-dehydratase, partial [hydrothermal vent metagenome]